MSPTHTKEREKGAKAFKPRSPSSFLFRIKILIDPGLVTWAFSFRKCILFSLLRRQTRLSAPAWAISLGQREGVALQAPSPTHLLQEGNLNRMCEINLSWSKCIPLHEFYLDQHAPTTKRRNDQTSVMLIVVVFWLLRSKLPGDWKVYWICYLLAGRRAGDLILQAGRKIGWL